MTSAAAHSEPMVPEYVTSMLFALGEMPTRMSGPVALFFVVVVKLSSVQPGPTLHHSASLHVASVKTMVAYVVWSVTLETMPQPLVAWPRRYDSSARVEALRSIAICMRPRYESTAA